MIPILYESSETMFTSNGLGRLRDCISCKITEERNGIFEADFEYPINGAHYEDIIPGRIVYVSHDDTGTPEPFDIVSYSKPIDGVVSFHAVHISYRLAGYTANGTNINSLSDALAMLETAEPSIPFTFSADFSSSAYMASADGTPRSVRQFLGGIEGSILDAYGGEYEFNGFRVLLHKYRGQARDFSVRYGVNMLTFQDDTDYQGTYTSCIPYWSGSDSTGAEVKIIGDKVDSGLTSYTGRDECIPLDVSDKFESMPSKADVEAMALSIMQTGQVNLPAKTIAVSFARLQDMPEFSDYAPLLTCRLCDTIPVIFPDYQTGGTFKIVKVIWDALAERYDSMELGTLALSLSQALGITTALEKANGIDQVIAQVDALDDRVDILNDYAELYRAGFTAGTTAARVTGLTIHVGNGDCFTVGTNQVTIKKSGAYYVSVSFVQSATNNATSVKRVALYRNGSSLLAALTRGSSWNTVTADAIYTLTAGDVMTMYARDESGTGTYSYGRIILMPVNV